MNKRFCWGLIIIVLTSVVLFFAFSSVFTAAKPAVDTVKVQAEGTSATLKGMVKNNGGKEITWYGFRWGTSRSLGEEKTFQKSINTHTPFSMTIGRLQAGTTYYYQAYAANSKGPGCGDIKSFTIPGHHNALPAVSITIPDDNSVITKETMASISAAAADDKKVRDAGLTVTKNPDYKVIPVSRTKTAGSAAQYSKLSKVQGVFGQFRYKDTAGGRIEIDPAWIAENIVTIKLPGLNKEVQVNKAAAANFIQAFNYIKNGTAMINGKQVSLLSLVETMDGTFVTRHVNWNPDKGLSNHSWGTAIDINANGHFRYVDPAGESNDPNVILWEKAFKPAGFSWGNTYGDSMHYELIK